MSTLQEDIAELNRATNEFGVRLALAYLPLVVACRKVAGLKPLSPAVEKGLRRRLAELERAK